MRAFVTGSTGLLGSNLVFDLLNKGHSVYALVRSMAKAKAIFGEQLPQGLELVVGDLDHVSDLAAPWPIAIRYFIRQPILESITNPAITGLF